MAHITEKRTAVILAALAEKHSVEWCNEYGEPGYTHPEKGVVLGNWNNVSGEIADYLEAAGYSLEWSDEWVIDQSRSKAYRSEPDSYSWCRQFAITDDGEYIFPDDGAAEFIEHCQITDAAQPIRCLPTWVTPDDLTEAGYTKANDESFEAGWHYGQDDDPQAIARGLFEAGADSVVFQKDGSGQFDVQFSAWIIRDDEGGEQ